MSMMKRRASMPCISFALESDSNKAQGEEPVFSIPLKPARRRGSVSIFDLEGGLESQRPASRSSQRGVIALPSLESPASKLNSLKMEKFGSEGDALSLPEHRRNPSNLSFDSKPLPTKAGGQSLVVEDEETALAHVMVDRMKALRAMHEAMSQRSAKVLEEAIVCARSAGVDLSKLTRPEATLKQLKAAEMRKQMQVETANKPDRSTQNSIGEWAPRKFAGLEELGKKTPSKNTLNREAQARLAGMMEGLQWAPEAASISPQIAVCQPASLLQKKKKMSRRQSISLTRLN